MGKYLRDKRSVSVLGFMDMALPGDLSWKVTKIFKLRPLFRLLTKHENSDGQDTSFLLQLASITWDFGAFA